MQSTELLYFLPNDPYMLMTAYSTSLIKEIQSRHAQKRSLHLNGLGRKAASATNLVAAINDGTLIPIF